MLQTRSSTLAVAIAYFLACQGKGKSDEIHNVEAPTVGSAILGSSEGPPAETAASSTAAIEPGNATPPLPFGTFRGRFRAGGEKRLLPNAKGAGPTSVAPSDTAESTDGEIEVSIEPTGELKGSARGALGEATLRGRVEDAIVRASFSPRDPHAVNAMTGVLIGKFENGVIRATIKVASADATFFREAQIELRKN